MSGPTGKPRADEADADAEAEELEAERSPGAASSTPRPAGGGSSIADLAAQGDIEGLLALARAYRAGQGGIGRDLSKCFEAYKAAAELGDAAAEHAVALFYLAGGVVPRDEREGAGRLRAAADKGHVPAKVYLGNLYELGVHYKADPSKADVWYRNAARAAGLTDEPGRPEHQRAMAELGCVRYCLEILADEATTEQDRTRFLQKAKAYGWREPRPAGARASAIPASTTDPAGLEAAEEEAVASSRRLVEARAAAPAKPAAAKPAASAPEAQPDEERVRAKAKALEKSVKTAKPSRIQLGVGLTAFLYTLVFMAAAIVVGHLATEGARVLVEQGQPVPVVGPRLHLILPLAVGVIGVVPTLLVYRIATSARAIVVGGAAAGMGALLWGFAATTLLATRTLQMVAFGVAGFLAALLVLGILGGAKGGQAPKRPRS